MDRLAQKREYSNVGETSELPARKVSKTLVNKIDVSGGVLDAEVLANCEAIAQQTNCIGCYAAGLADGIAKALPYGSPTSNVDRILR